MRSVEITMIFASVAIVNGIVFVEYISKRAFRVIEVVIRITITQHPDKNVV